MHRLAPINLKKLKRIQNEALRTASRLAKGCPIDFLRLETNVEPLAIRLQKNDEIMWDRYERLPPTDSRNQLIKKEIPPRLQTRHGFRIKTKPRMEQWDIERDVTTSSVPPWETMENLSIEYVPLEKKKSDYTAEQLKDLEN